MVLVRTPDQERAVIEELTDTACRPFDNPATRKLLKDIKQKTDIVIDEINHRRKVTGAGFDMKRAEETINQLQEIHRRKTATS